MATSITKFSLSNIGMSDDFFEKIEESFYVIKKEKLRKIYSENAVTKIYPEYAEGKKCVDDDQVELYGEAVSEFGIFSKDSENDARGAFGGRVLFENES